MRSYRLARPADAETLLREGKLAEAALLCHDILAREPANATAMLILARIDRRQGDERAAHQWLREADAAQPNHPPILNELAEALRALDRAVEAGAVYRQILVVKPDHVGAHVGLGWLARQRNDNAAAEAHFAAALEHLGDDPSTTPLQAQRATLLRELGRLDNAAAIYRLILAQDERHVQARDGLAAILRCQGDDAAALVQYELAAQLAPEDLTRQFAQAQLLAGLDRAAEAGAAYRQILAVKSDHVGAHAGLGWLARQRQDHAAAEAHFAAALEHLGDGPSTTPLRAQRATMLRELGRLDEAAAIYRHILAQDERHAHARDGLAAILRRQGYDAAALVQYEIAARLNPEDLSRHINHARLLAELGRAAEAMAVYDKVIGASPNHAGAHAARGILARGQGELDLSVAALAKALHLNPDHAAYRVELGRTLVAAGKWDEARRQFEAIAADSPQYAEAVTELAETAKAKGDNEAALALFERAATLAPLDHRIQQRIRYLKTEAGAYDWRTEIEHAITIARAPAAPLRAQLEAANVLIQYGLTGIAAALLAPLEAHVRPARQLMAAARQLDQLGLAQNLEGGDIYTDPAEAQLEALLGYQEKPMPGADTLLLVFGSSYNRVWLTFTLLHRLLRTKKISIVYCRDLRHHWYTTGVVGLGRDFASTVSGFRDLAQRHGARRILTLGNCVGCTGAMRFGLALGAEGVLALGPALKPNDRLRQDQKTRLAENRRLHDYGQGTLREQYAAAAKPPHLTVIYGEDCAIDPENIFGLIDLPEVGAAKCSGMPDVDVVKDLLVRGLLNEVLGTFIDVGRLDRALLGRIGPRLAA